jgi:hypothetical protein
MISFLHRKFPKENVENVEMVHKKNAPAPRLTMTERHKLTQLEKLADRLERMRLGDYVTNLNKTSRVLWLNFVSGIARGVGLTIGATLVIAIIFKIISALVSMNVPYLSDMMKDVQQTLESRYAPVSTTHTPVRSANEYTHPRRRN